ncbi:MAG: hypothetical protein JWR07_4088 [Nevskia sp.]|nr:hypothetical protein [Nevskia sp.]
MRSGRRPGSPATQAWTNSSLTLGFGPPLDLPGRPQVNNRPEPSVEGIGDSINLWGSLRMVMEQAVGVRAGGFAAWRCS